MSDTAQHTADSAKTPVSVVVPMFNERECVASLIRSLAAVERELGEQYEFEFVLVDDGSSDETVELLNAAIAGRERYRVSVRYPRELRDDLDAMGVVPAGRLLDVPDGSRVLIAGAVTHRQRPATAQGVTFMNIEDETGMVNVLCTPGVWAGHRKLAQTASALLIRGQVQNATGAVTVVAERMGRISMKVGSRSRDFR